MSKRYRGSYEKGEKHRKGGKLRQEGVIAFHSKRVAAKPTTNGKDEQGDGQGSWGIINPIGGNKKVLSRI